MTIKQLLAKQPCADGGFFLAKAKTLRKAWQTCERADWMLWALNAIGRLDEAEARTFACDCAERTLAIFEKEYPDDKRPRPAIEAARRCVTDTSPKAQAARSAARSAAESAAESAAWSAEDKWQADRLRELIDPFKKGDKP